MYKISIILILFLNYFSTLKATENDMLEMFGNRILHDKKEKKVLISKNTNINENKITIFGKIIDAYGEVNVSPDEKDYWEEGDTLVTKDGIIVLEYNQLSKLILMENTKIKILHNHINIIKGKLYFNIIKIDEEEDLKISTNFAEYISLTEGRGIIKINEDISELKLLEGFIKVYNSSKFFDNYNITSNYIYQYEYQNENDELMKLSEKDLFYNEEEFNKIEIYLEKERNEIQIQNEEEFNNYLKRQEES